MIMRADFPYWYSNDEFALLRPVLENYEFFLPELISFGNQHNERSALCVPLLGHSTVKSSATPSVYVVMGKGKDDKITCFRPDGKTTAILEDEGWKFLNSGWMEFKDLPTVEVSSGNKVAMEPILMRSGTHTVYSSNFIGKYFDSIVIPKAYLKAHLECVQMVRSSNPKYQSSFVKTLHTWFKKKNFKIYVLVNGNVLTLVKNYMELEAIVFKDNT